MRHEEQCIEEEMRDLGLGEDDEKKRDSKVAIAQIPVDRSWMKALGIDLKSKPDLYCNRLRNHSLTYTGETKTSPK